MPQTDKDLLRMLDNRRKAQGKSWCRLAREAGVQNAIVYRWYRLPGTSPRLNNWLRMLTAAHGRALLRTEDGRLYSITASNGTLNVPAMNAEAKRKGMALYKISKGANGNSGSVYNWIVGVYPTLRTLTQVLGALGMTVVIGEAKPA